MVTGEVSGFEMIQVWRIQAVSPKEGGVSLASAIVEATHGRQEAINLGLRTIRAGGGKGRTWTLYTAERLLELERVTLAIAEEALTKAAHDARKSRASEPSVPKTWGEVRKGDL